MTICNSCRYHSKALNNCNLGLYPNEEDCHKYDSKEDNIFYSQRRSLEDVLATLKLIPLEPDKYKGKVNRRIVGILSKLYLLYVSENLVIFKWPYGDLDNKHINGIKKKLGDHNLKKLTLLLVQSKEDICESYLILIKTVESNSYINTLLLVESFSKEGLRFSIPWVNSSWSIRTILPLNSERYTKLVEYGYDHASFVARTWRIHTDDVLSQELRLSAVTTAPTFLDQDYYLNATRRLSL